MSTTVLVEQEQRAHGNPKMCPTRKQSKGSKQRTGGDRSKTCGSKNKIIVAKHNQKKKGGPGRGSTGGDSHAKGRRNASSNHGGGRGNNVG